MLDGTWTERRDEGGRDPRGSSSGGSLSGRLLWMTGAAIGACAAWRAWKTSQLPTWRGRVAIVTGGSRGLGLLIARELADDGCSLAVCARDASELERAAADLRRRGADVLTVQCDVAKESDVADLVGKTLERFGRIDVLVNNAGEMRVGPLEQTTSEDFRRAHRVIFEGAVHCTLAVLPHMLRRGSGHVINVSSIGGRIAVPHLVPYDSAKFALQGFSEGMRAELAPRGIRVTSVLPGVMRTGSYRNAIFHGRKQDEYTWFALASSLPGLSMSAERAAKAVVRGAKNGDSEVVVPFYAKVLTRLHGLAPATAGALSAWIAKRLPSPGGDGEEEEGRWIERSMPDRQRSWFERWTTLGRRGGAHALQPDADGVGTRPRVNVADSERALSLAAGGLLLGSCLRRGGSGGWWSGLAGAALLARGATGRCSLYRSLGIDTANGGAIRIQRSITVGGEPRAAYELWRDLERLPRFLRHVRSVELLEGGRSRWTLHVTGHPEITFDAEIADDVPGERLSWRTLPDQRVQHQGSVRFRRATGGRGTVVEVDLAYRPVGPLSRAYARLVDGITSQQVKEDLRRFKQTLEAGETARTEGQPAGAGRERS